jgi:hypothetical protein
VCSEGIAATGFAAHWPAFRTLPAPCRPIACQPRVEMRTTSSGSRPNLDDHHGGAAGYAKYVTNPSADSANHRRMNGAHNARRRSHSTTATASATTKWEKYTQLATTSYQRMWSGSYRCCWSHTVGTFPPNMNRSASISSTACGVRPWSASPRDRLYPTSSATIGSQSRANARWTRRGWSIRMAIVASHSHTNARIGSVSGRPRNTHHATKPTHQRATAIVRFRRLSAFSGGAGARVVITTKVNDRSRPH